MPVLVLVLILIKWGAMKFCHQVNLILDIDRTLLPRSVKTVTILGAMVLTASVTLVLSAVSKAVESSMSVVVDSILLFKVSSLAARDRPCYKPYGQHYSIIQSLKVRIQEGCQ